MSDDLLLTPKISDAFLFLQGLASRSGLLYLLTEEESEPFMSGVESKGPGHPIILSPVMFRGSWGQIQLFHHLINGYRSVGMDWSVHNSYVWANPGTWETTFMWATNSINYPYGFLRFKIESLGRSK